jgi:mono/diheme cytochrome c family protein
MSPDTSRKTLRNIFGGSFEMSRLQAAPPSRTLCNFVIPAETIVIPTGAFHSRRERNAQWRDLLFLATAFAAIALLTLTTPFPAQAQNPSGASATADLPAGPLQAKATTACLECHEARIILQQRLSKAAWTKEVDKMVKWGAVVDAADRDALIDYLSANFSPDKPPYDPQRTSGSGKASK